MAVAVTSKHASVLGSSSAQTRTSGLASYAAGTRVLVVGHALSDGHTNGLGTGGTGWATPATSAVTNSITWTQVGSPTTINSSLGANYRVQSIMWISSVLTAAESFTITIDAHNGGTGLFFYGINTVELSGSDGTLVQSAVADDPDGNDTATFGSAPSGFQLLVGYAVGSHDNIVWSAAPTNFALLSGSTATPNGGTGCAIVTSSTNTANGVSWGWTTAGGTALVTTLILVEIAAAATGTNYSKTPADSAGVTDAATRIVGSVRTAADPVGLTDSAVRASGLVRLPVDPVGVSDGVSASLGRAAEAADLIGVTDASAVVRATDRAAGDAVGLTDSVAVQRGHGVADAVGLTDVVSIVQSVDRSPADSIGVLDAAGAAGAGSFSDNFNRADGADLGSDWTPVAGGMRIDGNTAYAGTLGSTAGVLQRERWDAGTLPGPDMAVQGTIAELSPNGYSDLRLMARWTGATSYYELRVNNSGEWYINRVTSGGETDIASGTGLTLSLPEMWRLEVEGSGAAVTLRVYRDASLVATHSDTAAERITSGVTGGIGGFTAGGTPPDIRLDDWSITALAAGASYDQTPDDAVAITDTLATVADLVRAPADPVGLLDAADPAQDLVRTLADPVGVTDEVTADLSGVTARSVDDPVGVSDAVSAVLDVVRSVSDPVGVTDSAATVADLVRSLADPVEVTDTGSPQTLDIGYDLDDPVGVSDSAAPVVDAVRAPADAVGVADEVSADATGATVRTPNDPVGVTDAAAAVVASARTAADPVEVVDTVSAAADLVRAPADPIGVSDSVSAVLAGASDQTVADPVPVGDLVAVDVDVVRGLADGLGVADTLALIRSATLAPADPVGVSDAVSAVLTGAGHPPVPPSAGRLSTVARADGFTVGGRRPGFGTVASEFGQGRRR